MCKYLILIIFLLTISTPAVAQINDEISARNVMLKFIELNNKQALQTDEAKKLLVGEALEWKNPTFSQIANPPDKIISVEKGSLFARVQVVNQNSRVIDLYFHLRFEDGWKISYLRSLALTHFAEAIYQSLKNKPDLVEEEKNDLASLKLILASDKQLTEWFQINHPALGKLVKLAPVKAKEKPKPPEKPKKVVRNGRVYPQIMTVQGNPEGELFDDPRTIEFINANSQKFPKVAESLKSLHLSRLETKSNGNIEIIIGGMLDNMVGFAYSPTGKPPVIDGWRYIWVEKVAAGWYLFRTT
jgi:hypothetical protein